MLVAEVMEKEGYVVQPTSSDSRHDVIQAVRLGSSEKLVKYCTSLQKASPVGAYVLPTPGNEILRF